MDQTTVAGVHFQIHANLKTQPVKIQIGLRDYLEEVDTFEACWEKRPNIDKQRNTKKNVIYSLVSIMSPRLDRGLSVGICNSLVQLKIYKKNC